MKRSLGLLLAAAIALVAAMIYFMRDGGTEPAAQRAPAPAHETPASPTIVALDPEPPPVVERKEIVAPPPLETPPTNPAPKPADDLAELRGRFMLPDGAPATDVKLHLNGWESNDEMVMKYGRPDNWSDLDGETDADGRFSFRFDPPRAYQFVLDAKPTGFAEVSWRWHSLPQHKATDVGEITLARSGSIRGKIVDSKGAAVPGSWMVYGDSSYRPPGEGGDQSSVRAAADTEGGFLLEGLPPGPTKIKAHSQIANWIDGPSVVVVSGEIVEANITYAGPDNSRRIVVIPFCRAFHTFNNPADGTIVLTGSGGDRAAKLIEGSSQSWSFDDLEPGSYTVEVRDPRYLPWSRSGITPGQRVQASLEGSATIALTVLDPDGATVDDYQLRLEFRNVNFMPNEFEIRGKGKSLPTGGVYTGLIPSDCTVRVDVPGYSTCMLLVDALAPNETRSLTARLTRGTTLRGVVLDGASRQPVANARISLGPYIEAPSDPSDVQARVRAMHERMNTRSKNQEARSDDHGRFEYANVSAATYELSAQLGAYVTASIAQLVIDGSGERNVEILLPATGSIVGRLISPDGASLDGLTIDAAPAGSEVDPFFVKQSAEPDEPALGSLTKDGHYKLGPLPAGEVNVDLVFPEVNINTSFNSSMSMPGPRQKLGTVVVEAGKQVTHDFDLRESFPGRLRLTVRVAGAPGASLVVTAQLKSEDESAPWRQSSTQTDAGGHALLSPLMPGEWTVTVQPVDSAWQWTSTTAVSVKSNSEAVLDIDIVLIAGTIQVLDAADGKPLTNRNVLVVRGNSGWSTVLSDAEGRIKLTMPIGQIGIADGGEPESRPPWNPESVQVEWTASGPVPSSVRVNRAPKEQ